MFPVWPVSTFGPAHKTNHLTVYRDKKALELEAGVKFEEITMDSSAEGEC